MGWQRAASSTFSTECQPVTLYPSKPYGVLERSRAFAVGGSEEDRHGGTPVTASGSSAENEISDSRNGLHAVGRRGDGALILRHDRRVVALVAQRCDAVAAPVAAPHASPTWREKDAVLESRAFNRFMRLESFEKKEAL